MQIDFFILHNRSAVMVNVSRKKNYDTFKIRFIWFLYIDNNIEKVDSRNLDT
jgi:hypothetical protein